MGKVAWRGKANPSQTYKQSIAGLTSAGHIVKMRAIYGSAMISESKLKMQPTNYLLISISNNNINDLAVQLLIWWYINSTTY